MNQITTYNFEDAKDAIRKAQEIAPDQEFRLQRIAGDVFAITTGGAIGDKHVVVNDPFCCTKIQTTETS